MNLWPQLKHVVSTSNMQWMARFKFRSFGVFDVEFNGSIPRKEKKKQKGEKKKRVALFFGHPMSDGQIT